ncbi:MAG: sugar phosphate isomerase/epimerase family protein [Spirochaetota bacterium]
MHLSLSSSWCDGSLRRLWEVLPALDALEVGSRGDGAFIRSLEEVVRTEGVPVTSVHAVAHPAKEGHENDYAPGFASLDAEVRCAEVDRVSRSIEWGANLGARCVVFHTGRVDGQDLKDLERSYKEGVRQGREDQGLFRRILELRHERASAHLDAAAEGLDLLCARFPEVDLCPETRMHYYEIPTLEELETIFQRLPHPNLGYWHDIGHTVNQDALGFIPLYQWQARMGCRCRGVHIHDVDERLHDHFPPGMGRLALGSILEQFDPRRVLMTLEVRPTHTAEEVLEGIAHLRRLEKELSVSREQ